MKNFEKIKNGTDIELATILAEAYVGGLLSTDDDPPTKEDMIDLLNSDDGKQIRLMYLAFLRSEVKE